MDPADVFPEDEGPAVDEGILEVEKPETVGVGEVTNLLPVGAPRGADDCPLIWFRTSALKVPVMPDKVNLAEKAIAEN